MLLESALGSLPASSRLWPASLETFRSRFKAVCSALGLNTVSQPGWPRPLDPGSLRAGSATALFQATEDAEFVRRRGRWLSSRVMEIYIQELTAASFFPSLPFETKAKISDLASAAPAVLSRAIEFMRAGIPGSSWQFLFSSEI